MRGPIAASLLSAYSRPTTLVQQFVNQQRVQAAAMATANLMNGTLPISTNTSSIKVSDFILHGFFVFVFSKNFLFTHFWAEEKNKANLVKMNAIK